MIRHSDSEVDLERWFWYFLVRNCIQRSAYGLNAISDRLDMYLNFAKWCWLPCIITIIGYKAPSSTIKDRQGIFSLNENVKFGGKKTASKGLKAKTRTIPKEQRDQKTPKASRKKPIYKSSDSDNDSTDVEYRTK